MNGRPVSFVRTGYNSTGYRHDGYGSMRAADVNSRVGLTSGLPLVPMGVSPMMPATSLGTCLPISSRYCCPATGPPHASAG